MIFIGIDPGTVVTGYGIIECIGNAYRAIDFGCIRPDPKKHLHDRYLFIHYGIEELLRKYSPHSMGVEAQYVNKDTQSAFKLVKVLGSIIIAAKRVGIDVEEYSPTTVKKAVTGNGLASKEQVQGMMRMRLGLESIPKPEDAADALAIAICHAQKSRTCLNLIRN